MTEKIEWRRITEEELRQLEENRCKATRGPRSTVRCELYEGHLWEPTNGHMGRGRSGQWFRWGKND